MTLPKELLRLQRKTKWSWEKMCREMHRVNGEEGCSHTTLFRYARGKVKRHNKLTARWIERGMSALMAEVKKREAEKSRR